jgi:hypothetical protein
MPKTKYVTIFVDDQELEVSSIDGLPLKISYALESPDDFQVKKGQQALSIKFPASKNNSQASNSFHNHSVADLTAGEVFKDIRKGKIVAAGWELLSGKAFMKSAKHRRAPLEYEYDFYAGNKDWVVELQDVTLFDLLSHISFIFSEANVVDSWVFDGTDENLPYVFAPVRYRAAMGGYSTASDGTVVPDDNHMEYTYFKPALSVYWLIYWAFKSIGYKVQSNFFDTDYFRRLVMPWTWGTFLDSDGTRLDVHRFLAKGVAPQSFDAPNGRSSFTWDLNVSNDSTDGGFDNNNDYVWDAVGKSMAWQYKPQHFGVLDATFSLQVDVNARLNGSTSDCTLTVKWYKNGVFVQDTVLVNLGGTLVGGNSDIDVKEVFFTTQVNPTDNAGVGTIVSAQFHLSIYKAKLGFATITANVLQFQLDYFKIPLGGTIDFQNYTGLKKYKFLDFFRGIADDFNLSFNTDNVGKVIFFEPTHPFSLSNDLSDRSNDGYYKNDFIDWNGKEDLNKDWLLELYSDYERELLFKYKDDSNDGILKVVQDRNVITLASGKYVLPARFKTGKREVENRFFSPTMHYEVDQWKDVTGVAPQMVCLIPENISNTSNSASANTFNPKLCYYKGVVFGVGGWMTKTSVGAIETRNTFPFMFAVNYKDGGEADPILSYSDEKIKSGSGFVVGKGLLKRFYWQRLAIMRNGQWYHCWFSLNNKDVAGQLHREYISYGGQRWELISYDSYDPLSDDSTSVLMRKFAPIMQVDNDNTFPAADTILNGTTPATDAFDFKYGQLKCLASDIPTTQ